MLYPYLYRLPLNVFYRTGTSANSDQYTVDTEHSDTLLALFKFGQTPCPVHVGY